MAKGIYIGENNLAKKVKKIYIGVNGVARKVKKAYIGVNGVAKQFYSGGYAVSQSLTLPWLTSYNSLNTLGNSNIIVAGSDGATGSLAIYDSKGGIIQNKKTFHQGKTEHLDSVTLGSDNTIVFYTGKGSSYNILNSLGNSVKEYTLTPENVSSVSSVLLDNGNVFATFVPHRSNGHYSIIKPSGEAILYDFVFNSSNTGDVSSSKLGNGNVLISFTNVKQGYPGNFKIYKPDGVMAKDSVNFNPSKTSELSTTTLKDGNALIAFKNDTDNGGYFVVVNGNGDIVKNKTKFSDNNVQYVSASTLENGDVLIAYKNADTSEGIISIYTSTGEVSKDSLVFSDGTLQIMDIDSTAMNNGGLVVSCGASNGGKMFYINEA